MKISAHEKFLQELRESVQSYGKSMIEKNSLDNEDVDIILEGDDFIYELEDKLDTLFGIMDTEEEE